MATISRSERNSTSPQKYLLRTWPSEGPEVLWTTDLGIGFGGPVIKDGKAYLLDRDDKYGDYMRCFDMKTGEELWKFGYEAPGQLNSPAQEVFRRLMKTMFIHAAITAIYIALILNLINLFGIKMFGLTLVVNRGKQRWMVLASAAISLCGQLLNVL